MNDEIKTKDNTHPLVRRIWMMQASENGSFQGITSEQWSFIFTYTNNEIISALIYGPTNKFRKIIFEKDIVYLGIVLPENLYIESIEKSNIVNSEHHLKIINNKITLPNGLDVVAPTYDTAERFVEMLYDANLLLKNEALAHMLNDKDTGKSIRSAQRKVKKVTGLTRATISGIHHAQKARTLLENQVPIADVIQECGYYDQSHLTREIKKIAGYTPLKLQQ